MPCRARPSAPGKPPGKCDLPSAHAGADEQKQHPRVLPRAVAGEQLCTGANELSCRVPKREGEGEAPATDQRREVKAGLGRASLI